MTELGVYILGATALAILAAAGIADGKSIVVFAAVLSSGAAYVSQFFAALRREEDSFMFVAGNIMFMGAAFVSWIAGVWNLF